jgi:Lrp/AsnC family leucine-responsive transcriptional regulator
MNLDALDKKVLQSLMVQGRITWAELANSLELSAPATADRVRRLEEKQVIQGYSARLNPEAIGCNLLAFLSVSLERPEHRAAFLELVRQRPEIQECHHVAGDDDYWLKVRCRHTRHLEYLISDVIKDLPGVLRTRTTIVLSSVKETMELPLEEEF